MNNVGALALMPPVVLRNAYRAGRSPSQVIDFVSIIIEDLKARLAASKSPS